MENEVDVEKLRKRLNELMEKGNDSMYTMVTACGDIEDAVKAYKADPTSLDVELILNSTLNIRVAIEIMYAKILSTIVV